MHFLSYACCLCCRPSLFPRTPRTQARAQAQEIVAASTAEGLDSERAPIGLDPLPYDVHDLQDALRVYIASHSSSGSNKQESSHIQPLPQPETDVRAKAICDASERIENVYIYEDVEAGHVYYPLPLPLSLSKKTESNVSSHGIVGSKVNETNQINNVKVIGSYARSREANMLMQQCGKVAEGVGDGGADQCSSSPPVRTALDNFEYDLFSDGDAVGLPDSDNGIGNDARKEEEEVASRHYELKDSDCFEEKESLSYFVKGLDTTDNKKRKLEISKNSEITAV